MFFFEKKNQKTFGFLRARYVWRAPQGSKVFLLLFFQKKKCFLPYAVAAIATGPARVRKSRAGCTRSNCPPAMVAT
jgi:hypothetical protein